MHVYLNGEVLHRRGAAGRYRSSWCRGW
jgi:hypothetical protein